MLVENKNLAVFPIPEQEGLTSITNFMEQHRIVDSPQVYEEASAIHWMSQAWTAYKRDHDNTSEEFNATEHSHGLVSTMLRRACDHAEASIVAVVTGSVASAEVLSRVVVESSMNVRYIVQGEPSARLGNYFRDYIRRDKDAIRNWQRELIG